MASKYLRQLPMTSRRSVKAVIHIKKNLLLDDVIQILWESIQMLDFFYRYSAFQVAENAMKAYFYIMKIQDALPISKY